MREAVRNWGFNTARETKILRPHAQHLSEYFGDGLLWLLTCDDIDFSLATALQLLGVKSPLSQPKSLKSPPLG
jgi:hypothetical protein